MRKTPQLRFQTPPSRMAGVSLLELLAVIAIVGILMGIGVTSYRNITLSYRISGEINGLLGDMQYARSEAIKQGQNVVICVAPPGANDCDAANFNWDQGWIVFADPTGGKSTGGNAALILRRQGAFSSRSAGGTGDTLTNGVTSNVSFDREGLALGLLTTMSGAGGAVIPLHDPTSNPQRTRCLWVTNVGSVSVQQPSATCS
jgi:type IV fimbrial biogenesis protein FimT